MSDKKVSTLITIGSGDKKQVLLGQGPNIKIQGQSIQSPQVREVDLVFVIDTTGSMSDKIQGLLSTCARFVDELATLQLDYQVAVVAFGDLTVPGDRIEATAFTDKVENIKASLQNIPRFSGGGNEGESSLEALEEALTLPFRPNTVKVVVLITDEPALQSRLTAIDMIKRLTKREILVFVVSPPLIYYKDMAQQNGGQWYQVAANTDLTSLLEMFKQLANKVSQVVSDVYRFAGGNVGNYLQLKPPDHRSS